MTGKTCLLFVLMAFALAAVPLYAAETASPTPYILFVQKDLRPTLDDFDFEQGIEFLRQSLPQDRKILVISFMNNDFSLDFEGTVANLHWPPGGFNFTSCSPATLPYRVLFDYLLDNSVRNTTIYVISNGMSQDLMQFSNADSSQLVAHAAARSRAMAGGDNSVDAGDTYTFTPDRYPTIPELVEYCKQNRVRLVGFFVDSDRGSILMENQNTKPTLYREAFMYVMRASKGDGYWNFTSFKSIFKNALKKYFLKQP